MCAVTGSKLILIEPLGFSIADKDLRRAGLDYWNKVFVRVCASYEEYLEQYRAPQRVLFSSKTPTSIYAHRFVQGAHLVFGSETQGLPKEILEGASGVAVTIPMLPERRSLNLSTSVGIATYEALRQLCWA